MGKKKGKDKNKLARMSEEERLRYLQHRAELEEEAKRRKQQLISTFMKVNFNDATVSFSTIFPDIHKFSNNIVQTLENFFFLFLGFHFIVR
jgi:hypothetical protein